MDKSAIKQIANKMIDIHGFTYSSWAEAKMKVETGKYYCCFDALSLCEYDSNLSVQEKNLLSSILSSQISSKHDRRHQQTRNEYEALFHFLVTMNSPYREYEILKELRPDFVLNGETQVGLEVVEFTTEPLSILHKIANRNFGHGKTPDEIKCAAVSKHGTKADWYQYSQTDGHTVIAPKQLSDCNHDQDEFALKILQKWEKYRELAPKYDKFILLCDARNTIAVTDEFDTHSIISYLESLDRTIKHFMICIMYRRDDGSLCVGTYDL